LRIADFGITARPKNGRARQVYAKADEKTLAPGPARRPGHLVLLTKSAPLARQPLTLSLHTRIDEIEVLWKGFEKTSQTTFYQTYLWCRAWIETAGKASGSETRVVVATFPGGETAFILPLQIRRRWGVRVLEWLSAPHNGYGHGLFAPSFMAEAQGWFAEHWPEVVAIAGPCDAVALTDMPERTNGLPHPFSQLFNVAGANRSYGMALQPSFDNVYAAKRSGETRRHDRRKLDALKARGEVAFGLPAGRAAVHETLSLMFIQQEQRLAEHGVHGVFGATERSFIHRLAELEDESDPVLLPYRLSFNGETLAVMLGARYGGTFWALISSLGAHDLRKYSPGDLALRKTIEACCEAGLHRFDFAAGDTSYKLHWADETVNLQALIQAANFRGLPFVFAIAAKIALKRLIKKSPASRRLLETLRTALLGRPLRR
jgi:CelD/BcsL family acetyltransferase involved in cellulose biosynthesis